MMDGALMVFIILECLHIMNLKNITMYQNLELITYQIHPWFFSNDSDDDYYEAKESATFNIKPHMEHLNIVFKYYVFEEVTYFAVVYKVDSGRVNIAL